MKFGKRQLVLATLVLMLGAAVYLSWILSDDHQLLATGALSSKSGDYGSAQYVNADADDDDVNDIDDVMNDLTNESGDDSGEATPAQTKLAQARLSRQQARDSASDLLEELLENSQLDTDAVSAAAQKACEIADAIILENNIESLIKAKGYEDCVVIIEKSSCNVLVTIDEEMPNDAIIIKDIVNTQSEISHDNIKIVNVN